MKLWRVGDVMTSDVVSVRADTPYREVVNLLLNSRVSAVPVVDRFGRPVGVVSAADLLHKVEKAGEPRTRILLSRRLRAERAKADGRTAGDVMTAPADCVLPSLSVVAAARRMQRGHVRRLVVENDLGRLVGIVTRSDLLKVHLRSDAEIRRDVFEEVFRSILSIEQGKVVVETSNAVVRLGGRTHFRSTADKAVRLARQVPGVVGVVNDLAFDVDDRMAVGSDRGVPFGVA